MEAAEETLKDKPGTIAQENPQPLPAFSHNGTPYLIEPDLDFIRALTKQGGESFKRCFQCGTCSATCTLSPDLKPFPRKEMIWAAWGLKDRLLKDPDIWLCYNCNDCSTRCPRGAKPGDVLAAIRQESMLQCTVPRFLGRWANQPQCIPLLLAIPAALLTLALLAREPIEKALGLTKDTSERIMYSYSSVFPHWLLNSFFGLFTILALLAVIVGVMRLWRIMKSSEIQDESSKPVKGLWTSICAAVKSILTHDKFDQCQKAHSRFFSHLSVFFGFLALSLVTIWVITASINPLIQDGFVYPFGFWNPWKILANAGGTALLAGCLWMIWDRMLNSEKAGAGTYFDWALLVTLLMVVLTGFFTEVLHFVRLEPHRHIAYFIHLVFVFALLMYLPYSKFAHVIYRTTALVYAEYSGRNSEKGKKGPAGIEETNTERKEKDHA